MSQTKFVVDKEALEVRMERVYDAPVEKVWSVYTDPNLIPQWWGPSRLTTTVDKMDFRIGGKWRFIHKDTDGSTYAFNGEYREIVPPAEGKSGKLVGTFEFEGVPGHILVETAHFEDVDGKTRIRTVTKYDSIGDLEGMVASGMESGAVESMERIAELV